MIAQGRAAIHQRKRNHGAGVPFTA
jgi:hypothetical protein